MGIIFLILGIYFQRIYILSETNNIPGSSMQVIK